LITSALFDEGAVALRLVDDTAIRQLNRRYRNTAKVTDVLAFNGESAGWHLGDIALNWDAVRRQAPRNGNSVETEAIALASHALLHLAGYGHASPEDQHLMDQRTRELCKLANHEVNVFGH